MTHLRALVARIRLFYDPAREPLRRSVYTALLGAVTLAVALGLLTGTAAVAVTGPLAALLAVPAVERARTRVTPVAAPALPDIPGRHALDRTQ